MILKFRVWLFTILTPVLKWTATIHAAWTHKLVTGADYYTMWPILKPGTIFTTRIDGDLTTLLVPGHYSHAAIYSPTPSQTVDESVIQAERDGVGRIDLVSFLLTKDEVEVFEPRIFPLDLRYKVMQRASEIAIGAIGDPYDFQFGDAPSPKSFYCSRLVWFAYDQACQENGLPSLFTPAPELEVPTVTPQMVAECPNLISVYHAGGKK